MDDALGSGWLRAVEPSARDAAEHALEEAFGLQRAAVFEVPLVNASGVARWTRVRAIPMSDADGVLVAWLGTLTDIDDERHAADRLRIAAAANAALAQTSGLDATLRTLTDIVVPELADWAMINLLEADGSLRVARAAHRDPARAAATQTVLHATMRLHGGGNADVLRLSEPAVYPNLEFARVAAQMRENGLPVHVIDAFETLGFRSAVFVPLVQRGRAIGVLQAVRAGSSAQSYDGRDVAAFADVAAAAATAIANAQIFDALLDSERHLAVVSRASDELARSLSLSDTYETFARIVVPELADWAAISVRDAGAGLRTVAAVHADPQRAEVVRELLGP
ncbi:MAG: GAF domain-containing protein, partial [Candidatus Velthaea sp.]